MKHDVIAMVGLPARGKTFISRSIVKFLNERDFECRIFNVGEYRRLSTDYTAHDFFRSDNDNALEMRNKFAIDALEDLCSWLAKGENRIAIYDATNSTKDRRETIYDTVVCKYNYNLLFIESICNKPNILEVNIRHKTNSPDYSRFENKDFAIRDFKQRIAHYESRYRPLGYYSEENKYSFIQIMNAGEDWHFHYCRSEVQLLLVHYLIDLYAVAPITSFGLGVWQVQRLEWKKNFIADLESRLDAEPIDILQISSMKDLENLEYQRVKAKGCFDQDPAHQLYLEPRQLVVNNEAIYRGRTKHQTNNGANIITPFTVDGTDLRILVNRGWLASRGKDSVENSSDIGKGKDNEVIELEGILRLKDNRRTYGLKNDENSIRWQVRDIPAMARVLKTAPIYIEADVNLSPGKGPIGGQTQLTVRNEHLNYAITWFSLAALSFLMWYTKYGRRNAQKFLSIPPKNV